MARLDMYGARVDPTVRLARLLQQFLGGPDPAGSAWRAWGHVEPVVGQALKRVDRSHQNLLAETLAMLWGDARAADLVAEIPGAAQGSGWIPDRPAPRLPLAHRVTASTHRMRAQTRPSPGRGGPAAPPPPGDPDYAIGGCPRPPAGEGWARSAAQGGPGGDECGEGGRNRPRHHQFGDRSGRGRPGDGDPQRRGGAHDPFDLVYGARPPRRFIAG
jgi:hypothetical protein